MRKIVKQVVAADVAQDELVVCIGRMYNDWSPELYARKVFKNNWKGFEALITWVKKQTTDEVVVRYIMEATGVYHESFAYFLDDKDQEVTIVLPNKISNYIRTLEVKTITDRTAIRSNCSIWIGKETRTLGTTKRDLPKTSSINKRKGPDSARENRS